MRKPLKDRNGDPIYSCPLSKEYRENFDKIKWSKPTKKKKHETNK